MSGGSPAPAKGPLAGVKVIEMAGKGPVPFCGMLLADHGADVLRIDRPTAEQRFPPRDPRLDAMSRGRKSVAVDLKAPGATDAVMNLIERADVLIEGYRPSVMERLGLGPDVCFARNEKLIYGRVTGWGREGPLANAAAHDINFLALSGLLSMMRRSDADKPMPPLNVMGDYAAGGLLLAFGVLAALNEAKTSGKGQVVDTAMTDGLVLFSTLFHGLFNMGQWSVEPGINVYETSAPYYDVYRTRDDRFLAVGAIEPNFFANLLAAIGADDIDIKD